MSAPEVQPAGQEPTHRMRVDIPGLLNAGDLGRLIPPPPPQKGRRGPAAKPSRFDAFFVLDGHPDDPGCGITADEVEEL